MFTFLRELLASDSQEYFNWLGKLLTKVIVVRLLVEAERDMQVAAGAAVERLRMVAILLGKYINQEDERLLVLNAIFWINEIMIEAPAEAKQDIEQVLALIDGGKYENQFSPL